MSNRQEMFYFIMECWIDRIERLLPGRSRWCPQTKKTNWNGTSMSVVLMMTHFKTCHFEKIQSQISSATIAIVWFECAIGCQPFMLLNCGFSWVLNVRIQLLIGGNFPSLFFALVFISTSVSMSSALPIYMIFDSTKRLMSVDLSAMIFKVLGFVSFRVMRFASSIDWFECFAT